MDVGNDREEFLGELRKFVGAGHRAQGAIDRILGETKVREKRGRRSSLIGRGRSRLGVIGRQQISIRGRGARLAELPWISMALAAD